MFNDSLGFFFSFFFFKALYTVYTFTQLWRVPVLGRGPPGSNGLEQGSEVCGASEVRCLWEEAAASLAGCVPFGLSSRKHWSESPARIYQSNISPELTYQERYWPRCLAVVAWYTTTNRNRIKTPWFLNPYGGSALGDREGDLGQPG